MRSQQENPPGELSAESDRQARARRRRWRRSPLGILCTIVGLAVVVLWQPDHVSNSSDYRPDTGAWIGVVVMIGIGIWGLTRSGAQHTAQYDRIMSGRFFRNGPQTVLGVRIMSGVLLAAGIIGLLLFTFVR